MSKKSKVQAMMSDFLRTIGEEKTEFLEKGVDGDGRIDRIVITKMEALARKIWDLALGKKIEDGEIPNHSAANLIFDRLEGKAKPVADDPGKKKITAAEKVTEQSKNRINDIGKK